MFPRKKFTWTQQVQTATGGVVNEVVRSYWNPSDESTKAAIRIAARVQVQIRLKKQAEAVGEPTLATA